MQAKDVEFFEELIEQAQLNAKSGFEMDYMEDIRDKFVMFGLSMYVTEKQISLIERIANK